MVVEQAALRLAQHRVLDGVCSAVSIYCTLICGNLSYSILSGPVMDVTAGATGVDAQAELADVLVSSCR